MLCILCTALSVKATYTREFEVMITCNLLLGIEVQAMRYWQWNACNALSYNFS